MSEYVVVRDNRLQGTLPGALMSCRNNLNIISTTATTRLQTVFTQINQFKQANGKIHTMFILCHGYAGQSNNLRMCGDFGGQGLQLGREGVLHTNVDMWTQVKNTVHNIVVYACAAANTEVGNEFTREDGQYLMGALAIYTNAVVYAADRIQWYNPGNLDFGSWEGHLFQFRPDGRPSQQVRRAPVEFSELASLI